jgi:hypothetical protein
MEELTPEVLVTKYRAASPSIDETALEGIYVIDWQMLDDAFGPANDVPALLRAILSTVEDHRDFAFKLLHETIWHQGTIYEATSYAVPFIQKILLSPQTPDKDMVAFLITSLATGYSENTEWVIKTRDAIGKDLQLLYPFLEHAEEWMRYNVIQTIGYYPQFAKVTIPLLENALLIEKNESCKKEILKSIKKLQEQ